VGAKLAQKIILELKDKLINLSTDLNFSQNSEIPSEAQDIQKILLSLGYEENEIENAIKQACIQGKNPSQNEEFLRTTLQILSA
ncbi:hypothetical protein IKE67_03485, partial [bacterium]|nr:hypothetical protein [bacterium]